MPQGPLVPCRHSGSPTRKKKGEKKGDRGLQGHLSTLRRAQGEAGGRGRAVRRLPASRRGDREGGEEEKREEKMEERRTWETVAGVGGVRSEGGDRRGGRERGLREGGVTPLALQRLS